MSKRGQLSLFIAVCILLAIVCSIIFFVVLNISGDDAASITYSPETESIKAVATGCVEKTAAQAIVSLGRQGGYITLPKESIQLDDFSIPYDYYEGQNLLPTKEQVEQAISAFTEDNLQACIVQGIGTFSSDVEFGTIKAQTSIAKEDVLVDVDYPITVKSADKTEQLAKFSAKVPVRLAYVLETANSMINQLVKNPDWFNLSYMSQSEQEIEIFPHDADGLICLLTDTKSKINGDNYTFVFASKFKENLPPSIIPIGVKEAKVDEQLGFYVYAIDPEDDKIIFTSTSPIELDKDTGFVRFKTAVAGVFTFKVKATDLDGNYDEESFVVKIR